MKYVMTPDGQTIDVADNLDEQGIASLLSSLAAGCWGGYEGWRRMNDTQKHHEELWHSGVALTGPPRK